MKSSALCTALCLCGLLALPLAAEASGGRRCMQTIVTDDPSINPGYDSCVSAIVGTFADHMDLQNLEDLFGFPWRPLGYSTDSGFGPFAADPTGLRSGTLEFDSLRQDIFAIGLEAAGEYAFYSFDYRGLPGTRSLMFDTLGLADLPGPLLTAAALYIPFVADPEPPGSVGEPGTLLLALAGLFALTARRRGEARGTT